MMLSRKILLLLTAGLYSSGAAPQALPDAHVAPNAPEDKPYHWSDVREADRALEPYVIQARASYPEAKARYLAGLPPQHSFFVTVELKDRSGKVERVFLLVDRIDGDQIYGRIWNDLELVEGYKYRQSLSVPEHEVMDWTITRPDGTEEGNVVGKFIDTLHEQQPP